MSGKSLPKVVTYWAPDGFRWRRRAANGEVVANSTEGYRHEVDMRRAMESVNLPPYILIRRMPDGNIERTEVGVAEANPEWKASHPREDLIRNTIKDFTEQHRDGWYYGTLAETIEAAIQEWEKQ